MKKEKVSKEEEQKLNLIDKLISKTKENPNYNNITKVIKVIKQIFNVHMKETDGEGEK